MRHYRIVSDFGYGDKFWLHRMVPEDKVIALLKEVSNNRDPETIEDAEDQGFTYYIEEDDVNDIEDWDWQDS